MDKDSDKTWGSQSGDTDFRDREDAGTPGAQPGRVHTEKKCDAERPTGKSTGRDTTGINPQDPIDPDSPNLITP